MKLKQTIVDPQGHVAKFIFTEDKAIAEVVAYKYQNRGVVCFSTMSGCPVGCLFCGTGKKFIRNLNYGEMITQIETALEWVGKQDKIQIMAMSMGEPMLNIVAVKSVAEEYLNSGFDFYLSTVGINDSYAEEMILRLAEYRTFGLQISLHCGSNYERKELLGNYTRLKSIQELKDFASRFNIYSRGKPVYYNYICKGNETEDEAQRVSSIIDDNHLTCSVLCNTGDFIKGDPEPALRFGNMCARYGVKNWSVFDPAGQDTIGGGCGQLLYVQEFLKFQNS